VFKTSFMKVFKLSLYKLDYKIQFTFIFEKLKNLFLLTKNKKNHLYITTLWNDKNVIHLQMSEIDKKVIMWNHIMVT